MPRPMKSTARLFVIGILSLPFAMLISTRLAELLFWTLVLLFLAWIGKAIWQSRRDEPARKARIAAILAAKPDYLVYGSGAPKWIAAPIFVLVVVGAVALMFYEAIFGPRVLHGFNGFLTSMMYQWAIPLGMLAAAGVWRTVAWDLRSRFPDRVLLFANAQGIGTYDGFVMPYTRIRRIDPCARSSRYGTDNWIEIDDGHTHQVHLNIVREPLDDILTQLRNRALAAGAPLLPAYANGKMPTTGPQLGYRMLYQENPWRAS
jgi:hypothetical protein